MKGLALIVKDIKATRYGKKVLEGISFELPAGSQLAIAGSSGSGKTSLAKALAGQLFTPGIVSFSRNAACCKPRIVFMPQSETLKSLSNVSDFYYQQRFNSCDAEDAATLAGELKRQTAATDAEIDEWLSRLSLTHRHETPLIQLSNGELKKMQLIRCLLLKPEVLIIDNPFTGLDAGSRRLLDTLLSGLAQQGLMLILITGEKDMPSCITHIATLQDGRLKDISTKNDHKTIDQASPAWQDTELPLLSFQEFTGPVITMKQVSVRYGATTLLHQVNWQVNSGECWWIKGPNGAGKSTLLSLVTADNPQAYSQELYLFGRRRGTGESIWDIKQRIGFVSPELHKFFDAGTSVHQAIGSGFFDTMGLYRPLNARQEQHVQQWLHFFRLEKIAGHPLSLLSAGQQRLALIARAMVKNPVLLALDEPCQGLDSRQTRDFIALIDRLHQGTNITLLYISHYSEEIPGCIDHVLELDNGRAGIYALQKNIVEPYKLKQASIPAI